MTGDLSAFYFDVRKDALYCDPASSLTRKACLTVLDHLFRCTVTWLARCCASPRGACCFAIRRRTALCISRRSRQCRRIGATTRSPKNGGKVRLVRRVVTGALEIERAAKRIGSSLEAAPIVHIGDPRAARRSRGGRSAEVAITSGASLSEGEDPRSIPT